MAGNYNPNTSRNMALLAGYAYLEPDKLPKLLDVHYHFRRDGARGIVASDHNLECLVVTFGGFYRVKELLNSLLKPVNWAQGAMANMQFLDTYDAVREGIHSTVVSAQPSKVFFTGHSLGGALATLAALDFALSKYPFLNRISMYNFGSPMVGDDAFRQLYEKNVGDSHRVVLPGDRVPWLPTRFSVLPPGISVASYSHITREHVLKPSDSRPLVNQSLRQCTFEVAVSLVAGRHSLRHYLANAQAELRQAD